MHQIVCQMELHPRPRWGAYSAPQTPWLNFRCLLLRDGRKRTREEGDRVGRGKEERNGRENERRGREERAFNCSDFTI